MLFLNLDKTHFIQFNNASKCTSVTEIKYEDEQISIANETKFLGLYFNPLKPNDPYSGRTAPLTSKRCILYIYSTNIGTEYFNPLKPNDSYSGRTAPLTSKRCILYIYSTNKVTEYFKHGIYCPFLSLQYAVCFIILTYLVPVLFTFYIQSVLKFKKIIPVPKG